MLIVGGYVTNRGNDKQELKPAVDRADSEVYTPETVCADTEYDSGEAVAKEKTAGKLKTCTGKAIYKKRKETVEPVFGIIKAASNLRFEDSVNFCCGGLRR
jgi:hypothetical protein